MVLLAACSGTPKGPSPEPNPSSGTKSSPWSSYEDGWTRIPDPPEIRPGATLAWAGDRLLYWGGRSPSAKVRVEDGFSFDPTERVWSALPAAPGVTIFETDAVWTENDVVFLGTTPSNHVAGVAFTPATEQWREVSPSPMPLGNAVRVWTGKEIVVWGGGEYGDATNRTGASYDPVRDRWHPIAPAPVGLNLADGVWAKRWVAVYGSLLDRGSHADTRFATGALYSPAFDRWKMMSEGSRLSPQATSLVWRWDDVAGALLAWDYEARYQEPEDPWGFGWPKSKRMPFEPGECYPDSATFDRERTVFAFYCGQAALFAGSRWTELHGGPLDDVVSTDAGAEYQLWRFADLVPADEVLAMKLEGITVRSPASPGDSGVCYGCPGFPTSFWVYRDTPPSSQDVPSFPGNPPNCETTTDYSPTFVPASGPAGSSFSVVGPVPIRAEDGTRDSDPRGTVSVWWNANWDGWTDLVPGGKDPEPVNPGTEVVKVGADTYWDSCGFWVRARVPEDVAPGEYQVVVIIGSRKGATTVYGDPGDSFTVTT